MVGNCGSSIEPPESAYNRTVMVAFALIRIHTPTNAVNQNMVDPVPQKPRFSRMDAVMMHRVIWQ